MDGHRRHGHRVKNGRRAAPQVAVDAAYPLQRDGDRTELHLVVERREINWRHLHRQLLVCVRSREAIRQPVSSMTLAATRKRKLHLSKERFQIHA